MKYAGKGLGIKMKTWHWFWKHKLGFAALIAITIIVELAVSHLHTPGQLDPITAQAMDMSDIQPPTGAALVELASIRREGDQLFVPKQAIQAVDGAFFIWTAGRMRARRVFVTLSGYRGNEAVIKAVGLDDGTDIVVRGQEDLQPGYRLAKAVWQDDGTVRLPNAHEAAISNIRYVCPLCKMTFGPDQASASGNKCTMDGAILIPERL